MCICMLVSLYPTPCVYGSSRWLHSPTPCVYNLCKKESWICVGME